MTRQILRSWLFVPANHSRRVEKALGLDADAVILDLEDVVALSEKGNAREMAREVLRAPRRCRLYVRVNRIESGFALDDLEAVVCPGLDGIMLPKVESARDVQVVAWVTAELERRHGMPSGEVELVALVETARGILTAAEIAGASSRLGRVAFGAADCALDLGVTPGKAGEAFWYARASLVVASRAAGLLPPVDTVFPDIRNQDGLEQEDTLARALGFSGKLVIHPDQIQPVNRIFSPSREEVAWARKEDAVRRATGEVPLRHNVIYPLTRRNLGTDTGRGVPIVHWEFLPGADYLELMFVPKGFGAEMRAAQCWVLTSEGASRAAVKAVLDLVQDSQGEPYPPVIIGVGIGGTADHSAHVARKALFGCREVPPVNGSGFPACECNGR